MALYKRGGVWWYVFRQAGIEHRGSTLQSNKNNAKLVESKVRANAGLALFGIGPPKLAPVFKTFVEDVFLPFVRVKHMATANTVKFYESRCASLLEFAPLASARLNEIDATKILQYVNSRLGAQRQTREGKIGISTVNGELTTLRVCLKYARTECGIKFELPKISRIKGETGRTFVVSGELEKAYLAAAPYPLKHAATLMLDLGLRPAEVVSLTKDTVSKEAVHIRCSKTVAGIRTVPQTKRSTDTLAELSALWPESEWLLPGQKKGSHYCASTLSILHHNLVVEHGWPKEFVLYSFRHTFGTRLAESGATPYAIMKAMGHKRIETSMKYIHLADDSVTLALKRAEIYSKMLRGEVQDTPSTSQQVK